MQRWIIHLMPLAISLFGLTGGMALAWAIRATLGSASGPVSPPAPSESAISPVFTAEVRYWADRIVEWSAARGLDPNLAATVMQIESCGDPGAVSRSGAQGLFQVMPFHFGAGEDMQDPQTNASRGLDYLSLGLERAGGQVGLALAGYNGGHSRIGQDASLWPAETRGYFYWGTGIYTDASSGEAESPRLKEWLEAGGASLCTQASRALGLSN